METDSQLKISLVVPMRDEEDSICELVRSIKEQSRRPDEVILVDGGSQDGTLSKAEECIAGDPSFRILEIGPATPGRGRNEGISAAANEWIALTDAGIILARDWLQLLEERAADADQTDTVEVVFGNFHPVLSSFFEKIAAFTYVPALGRDGHRGRSIASCLLRRSVWSKCGGFPDSRAAEDLSFIDEIDKLKVPSGTEPRASVYWELRQNTRDTFSKFVSYSKHNVLIGRVWDWHYGILRQYALLLPFLVLALYHSFWWAVTIPAWLALRSVKRIAAHRKEFGIRPLFNPMNLIGTAFLLLIIDCATFVGWIKAKLS